MSTEAQDTSQASQAGEEKTTVEDVPQDGGIADAVQTTKRELEAEEDVAVAVAVSAAATVPEESLPPKPKPNLCGICEKDMGKYKCPRCALP